MRTIIFLALFIIAILPITAQTPEENRFEKIVLDQNLNEPLELAVLPDERVLFIERHGKLKLYIPNAGSQNIATLDVSTTYNPKGDEAPQEAEDGLLGLTIDPNFKDNGWIYLYYSPKGDSPKNVLARYTLNGNSLELDSAKVILEIPTQRDECCHTGGSMDWDAQGNLYLSTGDNTSPRASDGYSPLDERPGRSAFDAQRTSGNTNDLRGKILRIHPEADGSYTIPEGNLFPKGTPKTRPEIYTMGHRNPYRIHVDEQSGFLYWGDVGPDSVKDSIGLGPVAEDEFNQAKKAGNFGWPYFVGRNRAYWDYDFETKESGEKFDPNHPLNNSVNNTGLEELPPAQKAFFWYTAGESIRFPLLGNGGRSAMAGPVYHRAAFAEAKRPFPAYYDNKWFIFEWMRDWIIAVHLNKEGNYIQMERFLPNLKLDHPIDMEFGPNGDLYILEYGQGWFMANEESKLVRIEFTAGNRKPIAMATADKTVGAAPLSVQFSSEGTLDYDGDELKYTWTIKDAQGNALASFSENNPSFQFEDKGSYIAELTVTDSKNLSDKKEISVDVGNEPPELRLELASKNKTFFFPGEKVAYEVHVSDREDGSLEDKKINPRDVKVAFEFVTGENRVDVSGMEADYHAQANYTAGKQLMQASDCKACHFENKKSIGPAYIDVASKYRSQKNAVSYLSKKIINGGAGAWGEVPMTAHPTLSEAEAELISQYILSLGQPKKSKPQLPTKGEVVATVPDGVDVSKGTYELSATYTDKGNQGTPSITEKSVVTLKSPVLIFGNADNTSPEVMKFKMGENTLLIVTQGNTFASFKDIDLSGIDKLSLQVAAPTEQLNAVGGTIEVHLDGPDGPLIGVTDFIAPVTGQGMMTSSEPPPVYTVDIDPISDVRDLCFLFKNDQKQGALYVPISITFESN